MREIKFRALDKENNKWYEPTYKAYDGELEYLVLNIDGSLSMMKNGQMIHESVFLDRFDLVQYTGLRDKNGKEIYEGDILLGRFKIDDVENHIWLQLTEKERKEQKKTFIVEDIFYPYVNQIPEDLEIIGNIYENPEISLTTNK